MPKKTGGQEKKDNKVTKKTIYQKKVQKKKAQNI